MARKITPKIKAVRMPRRFWTMKPVTKVKGSGKAELSRRICRVKKTKDE
jgi:hypothetical protein